MGTLSQNKEEKKNRAAEQAQQANAAEAEASAAEKAAPKPRISQETLPLSKIQNSASPKNIKKHLSDCSAGHRWIFEERSWGPAIVAFFNAFFTILDYSRILLNDTEQNILILSVIFPAIFPQQRLPAVPVTDCGAVCISQNVTALCPGFGIGPDPR